MAHPALSVVEYNLVNYRRTWRASIFSAFVVPVMFLFAMGKTVGGFVDDGGGLGVPYLDYLAPGMLASTTLQVGVFETAYPIYSQFHWTRTFHAMIASPLRPVDIVAGQLGYAGFRIAMSAVGFLTVMAAFGTIDSPVGLLALPAAILVGLASASMVFAVSCVISSDNMYTVLFRLGMMPMTLFAGVFFPVSAMPLPARMLAYVSPLWHGVELCRAASLATQTAWGVPVHLGYLSAWVLAGCLLAGRAFTRAIRD
jgi:lipooligosaccharide transport system permease protein